MISMSIDFVSQLIKQRYRAFGEAMSSDTKTYDKHLSVFIILCMLPSIWEQVIGHLSSEYRELNDPPNFASEWGISEWLISYSGGIVRRGITGEIIEFFSLMMQIPPNYVIVAISSILYIAVVIWTIKFIGKTYPVYFLLSPFLLGIPIFSGYFVRKDILIIFLFTCSIWTLILNNNKIIKYVIINILCIFAIFSHEMYFFVGLPLLIVAYSFYESKKIYSFNTILIFTIPIIGMFLTLIYKGNNDQILTILANWDLVHHKIAPEYCCFDEMIAAFFALSADFSWHIDLSGQYFKRYVNGIFWTPGVWILLWLICGGTIAKFIHMYDKGNEEKFLVLYVFQTICALPLFIIAIDHGRWIALIAIMSFITLYATKFVTKDNFDLPFEKYFLRFSFLKKPLLLWQKIGLIFLFGLPHLWETVEYQIRSIPIFDVILFLYYIFNTQVSSAT